MKTPDIKCTCGSTDLKPLRQGTERFQLLAPKDWVIWNDSGFIPTALACRDCFRITFMVKPEDRWKIGKKEG